MWSVKQAPDGGLNIIVEDETATQVAQKLMCWSQHDRRIQYVFGAPFQYFHIPKAICDEGTYGELTLMNGGEPIECNTSNRPTFTFPRLEEVQGIDPNSCVDDVMAPTGLVVVGDVGDTSVTIAWTYPETSPSPESPVHPARFQVLYRRVPEEGVEPDQWTYLMPWGLPGYTRRATIRGLVPGTAYEIAVATVDKRTWVGITSALSTSLIVTTSGTAPEPVSADLCAPPTPPIGVTVTEDTTDTTRMTVSLTADNGTDGEVNIDWGDGSAIDTNPGDGTTASTHQYATAGTYTIVITDADDPSKTSRSTVTVPFTAMLPLSINVVEDTTDTTRMTVSLTANNQGQGQVTVDFGDGTATETNAGDGTATTTHQYATAGTYTIVVTDSDEASRTASQDVTVPYTTAAVAAKTAATRTARNGR